MMMDEEFQDCDDSSLEEIDLSLLRLSSPPYDYSSSLSTEASPLKRSSPVSDEADIHKRRRISPQNPILINSYPETQSPNDPTRNLNRCPHSCSVSQKQETTTFGSNTRGTEKMDNDREEDEEINDDTYQREKEHEVEEDRGEGMRIERSGEGFVIRLKCRCKLAFRVLFSDHHLYFKPL